MEADSKNELRGRPKLFSDRLLSQIGQGRAQSRRQQQNRVYAELAHYILNEAYESGETQWEWLLAEPRKVGILSELGRIRRQRGEEGFWQIANWVADEKPKTKEAVLMLRHLRTGKRTPGSARELHHDILETIRNYRLRHPGTTQNQIETALKTALRAVLRTPSKRS